MTLCEKEEYRGLTINVYYDESPDDPRGWDNVATFVCEHHRYNIGDEHDCEAVVNRLFDRYVTNEAILEYFFKNYKPQLVHVENDDYTDKYYEYSVIIDGKRQIERIVAGSDYSEDEIVGFIAEEFSVTERIELLEATGEVVMLPISMYEHSGITLWLGSKWSHYDAQWDCSSIGFAYVEKSTAKEEGMLDPGEEYDHDWKKWAYAMMEGEMKTYDQFLRGEVYGYMIEDENGEEASDDLLCGCWGFFGDEGKEEMLAEAKSNIDSYLKRKREKRASNLDILAKNLNVISGEVFADDDYSYRISKDMFGFDFIERAKFIRSHVGVYDGISFSSITDEILEDMVYEIKTRLK